MPPELFQVEIVRNADWACNRIGTPAPFRRYLVFIIASANKVFTLTAGKFVPVCNPTMKDVRIITGPSRPMRDGERD